MGKPGIIRPSVGTALPRNITTLGVSWLNDQFKAVAVHRGVVEARWECPNSVEGPLQFENLIREAVQKTGYRGQTVSLVLAHPRLIQQLVDIPPVRGVAVQKILHRLAQQHKMFDGEAAWVCQNALTGRNDSRVVLHLFPRMFLNQLVQGCQRNNLYLVSVVPVSAALHQQYQLLDLDKADVAAFAAETDGSTAVVISRGDGQMLLARTLPGTWADSAERLALDLNRTVLFVSQQYGVAVNKGLWLFGPTATERRSAIQPPVQVPVDVSPAPYDPFYWAIRACQLRHGPNPNLVSPEQQNAVQRHAFASVVTIATVVVVLGLLSVSGYAVYQARQEANNVKVLSGQLTRLQTRENELQQYTSKLARKQHAADVVLNERPLPVPSWFLGYLSEAVPSELVVTNLHIARDSDACKVVIAGTCQSAVKEPTPAAMAGAVGLLKTRLAEGPFHLRLLSDSGKEKSADVKPRVGRAADLVPSWIASVANGLAAKPGPTNQFTIEGVMR